MFKLFTDLLNEVEDQGNQMLNVSDSLLKVINYHTTTQMSLQRNKEALLSKIQSDLKVITKDEKNLSSLTTPISLGSVEERNKKLISSRNFNLRNPDSVLNVQF